jgi:pyruvate/2-oxoglutarate dehydrogenase complex dihydrolipoamide acyltransferase (E2) component
MSDIHAVTVPKWGLSMDKGTVTVWHKQPGDPVRKGEDLLDVESDKIANVIECPADGILRRQVAAVGDVLPVGALLGVIVTSTSRTRRSTRWWPSSRRISSRSKRPRVSGRSRR